jgi:hypothetical protein
MTAQLIRGLVLALAVCVVPASALADQGGPPNGNPGKGASPSSASSGNSGKAPTGQAKKPEMLETDEDAATVLIEVNAGNAMPLSALRAAVKALSDGRILDVTLIRVHGLLAYDVTVQESNNLVRQIFVDASSGDEVTPQ